MGMRVAVGLIKVVVIIASRPREAHLADWVLRSWEKGKRNYGFLQVGQCYVSLIRGT